MPIKRHEPKAQNLVRLTIKTNDLNEFTNSNSPMTDLEEWFSLVGNSDFNEMFETLLLSNDFDYNLSDLDICSFTIDLSKISIIKGLLYNLQTFVASISDLVGDDNEYQIKMLTGIRDNDAVNVDTVIELIIDGIDSIVEAYHHYINADKVLNKQDEHDETCDYPKHKCHCHIQNSKIKSFKEPH